MKILGLQRGIVALISHRPEWKLAFEAEKAELRRILGPSLRIEHVGSTAVAGLDAKPIIDIAVAVTSLTDVDQYVESLRQLGYEYRGEAGVPGRRFFVKGPEEKRTTHLHFGEPDQEFASLVKFRDALRHNPRLVKQYSQLKGKLAQDFANDRKRYTSGKHDFIQKVLKEGR